MDSKRPTYEELLAENERLRAEVDTAAVLLVQLSTTAEQFESQLGSQAERIAQLEALLDEARRAGKRQAAPFSKGDPKPDPKKSGRKKGKAHGRHGHRAQPVGDPDRDLDAPLPSCCPNCGDGIDEDGEPAEQWVTDFVVVPVRTRFRVHVGHCRGCGKRVQGRHPEQASDALGAAGAQIGPYAKTLALWLHYGTGMSFGRCAQTLAMLGIEVTAGALCQAAARTGTDLVPTYDKLLERVHSSAVVVMDETGWRIGGERAWLWVATTPNVTAYNIAPGRSFDDGCELVPADYSGTIARDGWAPYRSYTEATHQTCTAHLLRRCNEMIADQPGWAAAVPQQVKGILQEGLAARDLPDDERHAVIADLTERIELLAAAPQPHNENRKLLKHLTNEADALFTFLADPAVDATNWRAEQAIRPAVVNRKTFGGNRTDTGAATQARITSVIRTARQQGVDIIDLLVGLARAPDPTVLTRLTD